MRALKVSCVGFQHNSSVRLEMLFRTVVHSARIVRYMVHGPQAFPTNGQQVDWPENNCNMLKSPVASLNTFDACVCRVVADPLHLHT